MNKEKYIKNWGIHVGTFDEEQLRKNEDDHAIDEMQEKYPDYKYINYKTTKKRGKKAIAVYICAFKDLRMRL